MSAHGLLSAQEGDNTPFYVEGQGPTVYSEGNQTPATVRQLERDFGSATVNNPYEANSNDPLIRYLADPTGSSCSTTSTPTRLEHRRSAPSPTLTSTSLRPRRRA